MSEKMQVFFLLYYEQNLAFTGNVPH